MDNYEDVSMGWLELKDDELANGTIEFEAQFVQAHMADEDMTEEEQQEHDSEPCLYVQTIQDGDEKFLLNRDQARELWQWLAATFGFEVDGQDRETRYN